MRGSIGYTNTKIDYRRKCRWQEVCKKTAELTDCRHVVGLATCQETFREQQQPFGSATLVRSRHCKDNYVTVRVGCCIT